MFDINTTELLLSFHGNYIPSKFVFTSDDRLLYVGYAVDCLFKVNVFCAPRNAIASIVLVLEGFS